jgi:D,D-heptose 1,7-bisphosphate phosphatase
MAGVPRGESRVIRQGVILAGGLGTRLKTLTQATPKPLLEVGGRPFLDYLLDEVARHGFDDILLLAGHLGEQVSDRYAGREWRGARIRVLREPEPLGTGGALRFALPHLHPNFLLMNGDSFFDMNLRAVAMRVPEGGVAMALRSGVEGARYGRVMIADGMVKSFHAPKQGLLGPINAGIYAMDRTVLGDIPEGKVSLESDVLPRLAAAGRIRAEIRNGYFIDIGVPDDFARAQSALPESTRRPAVFFDRDGVLNEDRNYVHRPEDFTWMPGAREAIRHCNERGIFVFVVTNQAGVARGFYDEKAVRRLHRWMDEELAAIGEHVDAYEYCPHHPDGTVTVYAKACDCRKPGPGMIQNLLAAWPVDAARSLLIGDKLSDIGAAEAAGILGVMKDAGSLAEQVGRLMREVDV